MHAGIAHRGQQVLAQFGEAAAQLDGTVARQRKLHAAAKRKAFAEAVAAVHQRQAYAVAIASARTIRPMALGMRSPQRVLDQRRERALRAVERHDDLAQRAACVHGLEVAQAELRAVQAHGAGQPVDLLLERELHLYRAKAAKRAGHAVVGIGQAPGDVDELPCIGTGRMFERRVQHFGAMGRIGAGVGQDLHAVAGQPALCVAAAFHVDAHGMALDAEIGGLRAPQVQAHAALGFPGEQRGNRLHGEFVLAAIRAADGRADTVHALGRQAEQRRHHLALAFRVVVAEIKAQPALAVGFGHTAFGF